MSTRTDDRPDVAQPRLGGVGWLRWTWRQLTSMRTALFLLLLLAIGAIPGSTFPQRSIDPARTTQWIADHSTAGPLLDRLGFFEVYASPWFAAIYLLLFVSLIGCVLPRTRILWHQLRSSPPRAPRRLDRLAAHRTAEVQGHPEEVREVLRGALRGRRYRVHAHDGETLSAEKGYLRETGNLVFHVALIGVLVGVAWGHLLGWKGDVIVPVGKTFANTLSRYDTFSPGPWVDVTALSPFTLRLDDLDVEFETETTGRGQFGAPRDFEASTTFTDAEGSTEERSIRVNGPLETGAGTVFLLGNGYAPRITVRDAEGTVLYSDATPFLAQDNNYTSVGAVKVPGAAPQQLGFAGFFLPTGVIDDERGPHSVFPDALGPPAGAHRLRGRALPERSAPVRLLPRHRGDERDPGRGRRGPAPDPPAARGVVRAPGWARVDHLRRGRALRGAVHPHGSGQGPDPRGRPAVPRGARRLPRHPASKGLRARWAGGAAGSYCGVRRRPGEGRRRRDGRRGRRPPDRTRRNAMTDTTLAQLSNTSIYSATVVLTLAMVAYAVYLARLVPSRERAAVPAT